jgi:hypothetical protein
MVSLVALATLITTTFPAPSIEVLLAVELLRYVSLSDFGFTLNVIHAAQSHGVSLLL